MSRAHHYHQPNAPDPQSDESDSDLELDLQELDPYTSDGGHGRSGVQYSGQAGQGRAERQIPLRSLRIGRSTGLERESHRYGDDDDSAHTEEQLRGLNNENTTSEDSHGSFSAVEDEAPLLSHKTGGAQRNSIPENARRSMLSPLRLASFVLGGFDNSNPHRGDARGRHGGGASRTISIGQYPAPSFPPNTVSNAKYTAWSFLPRTLYNEFSFFYNLYFLLVALSQIIPFLRIGYLSTYIDPLAFVLTITLGKEALDDIGRRRRDSEANKEEYSVLRLHDSLQGQTGGVKRTKASRARSLKKKGISLPSKRTRLDAIEEEEESMGGDHTDSLSNTEVEEVRIKSRDLKVGDVLKLGKDQRIPADLVILKSYPTESAVAASDPETSGAHVPGTPRSFLESSENYPSAADGEGTEPKMNPSENTASSNLSRDIEGAGETFIRTDQLDGETDWKLRLASPLTQSLDLRSFTQIRLVAAKPDRKVNEFFGTVEYCPQRITASAASDGSETRSQKDDKGIQTAPLNIDNTAWANTVLASNATVLAVVVYTGSQTRQALSTSASRSKNGLLDFEINNLTKILFALTLTLSIVLVALEGFEPRDNEKWYVAMMKFLILFSTIIPISLRVNLDMGKSVYARFIERDQGIPGTVVRTSTIPEELGRIEYLLSDKTGTLTQNGMYPETKDEFI